MRTDSPWEPWPPAASLLDIVRCNVVLEDPYAIAVLVAYLQKEFESFFTLVSAMSQSPFTLRIAE